MTNEEFNKEVQEEVKRLIEQADDELALKDFIEKHGRPPNTNDFFDRQTAMLNNIFKKRII